MDKQEISKGKYIAVKPFPLRCHFNALVADITISFDYININLKISKAYKGGKIFEFLMQMTGIQVLHFSACYKKLHFTGEIISIVCFESSLKTGQVIPS